jgi:hypothetical protein
MNVVVIAVVVLFYIQIPGLDWIVFPFYAAAAMCIGCVCGIALQIVPWPTRGSKELLLALGMAYAAAAECWRCFACSHTNSHTCPLSTGLSLNAASRGVQCAIGHFTADEKRDVERLYLSEKAQLMTQKILENIAIAKAVHILFSPHMRCCFALTDANCPCCVSRRGTRTRSGNTA